MGGISAFPCFLAMALPGGLMAVAVAVTMLGGARSFLGFVRRNFLRKMARQEWEGARKDLPLPLSALRIAGVGLIVDAVEDSDEVVHLPLHTSPVIGGEVGRPFGQDSQQGRQSLIDFVELVMLALLQRRLQLLGSQVDLAPQFFQVFGDDHFGMGMVMILVITMRMWMIVRLIRRMTMPVFLLVGGRI